MKKLSIIIVFALYFLAQNFVFAQNSPPVTLKDPHNTVYVFLAYLQEDNYQPDKAVKTLYGENSMTDEEAEETAVNLKKVLDAQGLYVSLEAIPAESNFIDSASGVHKYVLFSSHPRIYVKKYGKKWLWSKETVEAVPVLYSETFPFALDQFSSDIPEFAKAKFLGIRIWQYIGVAIFLLAGYTLYRIIAWILGYFFVNLLSKSKRFNIIKNYIKPVARPISMLIILMLYKLFLPVLQMPIEASAALNFLLNVFIPFFITLLAYRLSDFFADILATLSKKTKSNIDDNLIPLARKAFKVIVVILGGLYILANTGNDITPLLASVSIGGLAFALAAQDTIKNLFGSVTIFTDQPFDVGDWIVFDGVEGTVEEVGVRSTRVRTFYNSVISIPNGKIADMKVDNMGRRQYRRFSTNLSVTYDTPPDLIETYVEGLRQIVAHHPDTWKDYYQIHLNNFGASSLDILFYIFFDVPDWGAELKARHQVMLEAIRLAEELGVRFAFPTNTIHIEEMPGRESLTPNYSDTRNQFRDKMEAFLQKRKSLMENDAKEVKN